jgi:hypothetical protein
MGYTVDSNFTSHFRADNHLTCPRELHQPQCESGVLRYDGFRHGRSIAQRIVRTNLIMGLPPVFQAVRSVIELDSELGPKYVVKGAS